MTHKSYFFEWETCAFFNVSNQLLYDRIDIKGCIAYNDDGG